MIVAKQIKVIDSGGKGLKKNAAEMRRSVPRLEVRIGIFDAEQVPDSDLNTAQLLATHEFGSPTRGIPSRPVLRQTLAANVDGIKQRLRFNLLKRKAGFDYNARPRAALAEIGKLLVKEVKATFGSSRLKRPKQPDENGPLVDTGRLRRAIKYKVVKIQKAPK